MELDSRIKKGKRPLTCLDVEQARKFEGKLCLFSSSFVNYKNIREYAKYPQYTGILAIRDKFNSLESEESPYRNGNDGYLYEFILPLEWVEEEKSKPKYRPYTKNEFLNMFECGKPINIRHKDDGINVFIETLSSVKIDNYMEEVYVRLYERAFSLKELFDEFEWQKSNGEWHPFGVEE